MDLRHLLKSIQFSRSIGVKLFVLFLAFILIASLLVGITSYQIAKGTLADKIGLNSHQVTSNEAHSLDLWIGQLESMYNQNLLYAQNNKFFLADFQAIEKNNNLTEDEKRTEINRIKTLTRQQFSGLTNANPQIHATSLIRKHDVHTSEGFIRYTRTMRENVFDQPWVETVLEAKGAVVMLPPQRGSFVFNDADVLVFGMAKAYYNMELMQWLEVVIVEFRVQFLQDMLRLVDFGGIGDVTLISNDNSIIYSNVPGFAFGQESNITWSEESFNGTYTWKDDSGKEYIVAQQVLDKRPWNLVGRVPLDVLLEDANKIKVTVYVSVLGSVILAILLGIWIYFQIGRPLEKARDTMKKAEEGDLGVRLQFTRSDEIGNVGSSFDNMLQRFAHIVNQTRQSVQHLNQSTDKLNSLSKQSQTASKEISVSMEEVATGALNLAKDAEKSNALTIQLFEQLNDVLEKNKAMQHVAKSIEESSNTGSVAMQGLSEQNKNVEQIVKLLQERIQNLALHATSISKILDLLNGISKQINILSLNASIVAAQSGEAGKAFMVVAHEIRNLAHQSNKSIEEVAQVVNQIQQDMKSTTELVQSSMPIFKEQMASAESSQAIFKDVATAMLEFRGSFDVVWNSLQQSIEAQKELSEVMMQVSAISEESSATTETVSSLASNQYQSSETLVQMSQELEEMASKLEAELKVFKN